MKKSILIVAALIASAACTESPKTMTRIMQQEGITNFQFTGYQFFECGKDDSFSTGFRGTKNGQTVKGVVCSGLLKGHTVRYD